MGVRRRSTMLALVMATLCISACALASAGDVNSVGANDVKSEGKENDAKSVEPDERSLEKDIAIALEEIPKENQNGENEEVDAPKRAEISEKVSNPSDDSKEVNINDLKKEDVARALDGIFKNSENGEAGMKKEDIVRTLEEMLKESKNGEEKEMDDPKRTHTNTEPADEKYGDGNYEGDIQLTKEQQKMVKEMEKAGKSKTEKRKFFKLAKIWPQKTVYYEMPPGDWDYVWLSRAPFCAGTPSSCTSRGMIYIYASKSNCWFGKKVLCGRINYVWRNAILAGIRHIERSTCIRFKVRNFGNRIRFQSGNGCRSNLGMIGKKPQIVSLKRIGCMRRGTVVHELLHALGFHHEQTRPDRDNYITVHFNNIKAGKADNFRKTAIDTKGVKYDIQSVMQYHSKAFSKNGGRTITVKANKQHNDLLGNREAMSYYDRLLVNKVYGCAPRGLGIQDNGECTWVGSWPFCSGFPSDCPKRGMTYSPSSRGFDCSFGIGQEVCCKHLGFKCKQWIGKAPFCAATSFDCEKRGLHFMRFDYWGDQHIVKCQTGKKVCCG